MVVGTCHHRGNQMETGAVADFEIVVEALAEVRKLGLKASIASHHSEACGT